MSANENQSSPQSSLKLTTEQALFLKRHKIAKSDVFDASGLSTAQWQAEMDQTGQGFAINTNPCEKAGHTIRTHKNHCVECNTANIAFYRRYRSKGYVYIAGSVITKRIKVGTTTDIKQREQHLNMYAYGNANDWEMFIYAKTERAGECEFDVHSKLSDYAIAATYVKAGKTYQCYEVFSCKLKIAFDELKRCLPKDAILQIKNPERAKLLY